jgi:hypothetical protein
MKSSPLLILATALLAGGASLKATAQDKVADEMLLCMQLRDDAERLACFDRLSRRSAEALERGRRLGAPATPESGRAGERAPGEGAARAAEARPDAPERRAEPADPAARFGFASSRAERAEQPDSIRSRVPGLFLGWTGETVFRLENGQVWRQTEPGSFGVRLQDPEVEISRGWLGGYFLSVEGLNRRVRVERVE